MRNVQHKKEAYWFYRFLSIFYDNYVNPFFWTERMRDEALRLGDFNQPDLQVIDVGSGTGFTTQGIVNYVEAENITCVDQSDHQMAKAKNKPELQSCTFRIGDAEEIPAETDAYDRYVSAGSIEYWPDPQRGIVEAYRVVKPGGKALMIGPLRPQNAIARWAADTWMLFPEEDEYIRWYEQAGFTDLQKVYLAPSWVQEETYGLALVGTKPQAGASPLNLPPLKTETAAEPLTPARTALMVGRLLIGNLAGFLFIPMALYGYARQLLRKLRGADDVELDPLTKQQTVSLAVVVTAVVGWLLWRRKKQ